MAKGGSAALDRSHRREDSSGEIAVRKTLKMRIQPNKAPEPTTFAVTSRATECLAESRAWAVRRTDARAAPAKVVAHL